MPPSVSLRQPKIHFLSSNQFKINEVKAILESAGAHVEAHPKKIEELQTEDVVRLVRDKVLKAFDAIGRPVLVEHTGLSIEYLNGLPGGLTQIFWDNLLADKVCELFGSAGRDKVIAKTTLAYCDGKKVQIFHGEIQGSIAPAPRGPQDFQWDCVFVPEGHTKTFAEMGAQKNEISMRRIALDQLAKHMRIEHA